MNMMIVLVAMCLLCGVVSIYVAASNSAEERRNAQRRKLAARKSQSVQQLHEMDTPIRREVHTIKLNILLPLTAVLCLSSACLSASAQETIHARAGQVTAINLAARTLTLTAADGSTIVFKDVANPEPAIYFDKDVRSKTVPTGSFNKVGAHVIVFYFGFDNPTAVAIKELGSKKPKKSTGSVATFDRHQHLLTLKSTTAEPEKLVLTDDTVLDTPNGIVKLSEYHPNKGEQLRCFTQPESQTALFVASN
jgi:hypothetical protein